MVYHTGTETWVRAMYNELTRQGHSVTVFTNDIGKAAAGLNCTDKYCGTYDFAIVNHRTTYDKLPNDLYKIFTSHSSVFDIEKPPKGADYVCINERVGTPVIRQGVDTKRFAYRETRDDPVTLYLSNPAYSGARDMLAGDCIMLDGETSTIEDYIYKADIVISMSRGAIEAMSCGRNVIYGDFRRDWSKQFMGYGMITEENYNDFLTGECFNKLRPFTIDDIRREIQKYDKHRGKWLRACVERDFNIEKTAKEYVNMYERHISG